MYKDNEIPKMSASLFFENKMFTLSEVNKMENALKKFGFSSPKKIFSGIQTKHRVLNYKNDMKDFFAEQMVGSDVIEFGISNHHKNDNNSFWQIDIYRGVYVQKHDIQPRTRQWGVFTINATYEWLSEGNNGDLLIGLFEELILIIDPFYGSIDDISEEVRLMSKTSEKRFIIGYPQSIHWGNYFGPEYCRLYDENQLKEIPIYIKKMIGNGFFFMLGERNSLDSILSSTEERKKISKYLSRILK